MHIVTREKINISSNRNEAITPGRTEIGVFYLKKKDRKTRMRWRMEKRGVSGGKMGIETDS